MRKELDEYKRIANTDSLTRLANRRAFDDKLAQIYSEKKQMSLTALVLCDIDNFKKINDSFGHPVGDKILATVGNVIKANVRKDVFVARTGGEEFAIIIEGNTETEALQIAEPSAVAGSHALQELKDRRRLWPGHALAWRLHACDSDDPNEIYSKSDIALYCAKNSAATARSCLRTA